MNKKLVVILVAVAVMVGGFFISKTVDTTPVVKAGCVVTDTSTIYHTPKQGGNKHYIKTENCGKLRATRTAQKSVEVGKTYDITMSGLFTWDKVASETVVR